jgi:hypothetical protein
LAEWEKERRTHGKSKTLLTGAGLLMESPRQECPRSGCLTSLRTKHYS